MSLVVLGLSHHGAPLPLLESVALDPDARTALERAVLRSEHVTEAVVVSTCNRTEVYAECLTFHGALADVTSALAETCSVDRAELQPHLFVHYEDRGIAHVFASRDGDHDQRFAGVHWRAGSSGVPLLENALSSLDCDVQEVVAAGDHYLVLGAVTSLFAAGWGTPLVHHQGTMGSLHR